MTFSDPDWYEIEMKDRIADVIARLRRRVPDEVPEVGEFKIVYEAFKNPNPNLQVTDFVLKITKPPKGIEGHERKRYLEFAVYDVPCPYICSTVVGYGDKQTIMRRLEDPALVQDMIDSIPQMVRDLEDSKSEIY